MEDGVRILRHSRTAISGAPSWEVSPTPIVRFGGQEGDVDFDLTNAFEVALLSGGRLAALPIGRGLLLFESDGRGTQVFGRRGQGPGDFLEGRLVALPGDTVLVLDRGNARITWIVPGKGVVRTESTEGRLGSSVHRPLGQLPGGSLVAITPVPAKLTAPKGDARRRSISLVVLSQGGPGRSIAELPDLELRSIEVRGGGKTAKVEDLLRLGLQARVVLWDTLIASGDGSAYAIDLRRRSGRVVASIRVDAPRRPVTAAMREAAIRMELARLGPRGSTAPAPAEQQRIVRSAPYADSLPAFAEIFASSDGLLWVLDARAPGERGWVATAFRLDGAIVARLRGDGGSSPVGFAKDRVLLRWVDEDDVVTFQLHAIRPRR